MTGKVILYSLILLILAGISSCGIYRPNVVNVPSFQQKGQAQLSGHISFSGYDGQASFALSDKMALVANYSNMGTRQINTSVSNYTIDKHSFGELGIGYYKKKYARPDA